MKIQSGRPFIAAMELKEEIEQYYPNLDSTWAINWLLNKQYENLRKEMNIIALMNPEVKRVLQGAYNAKNEAN